MSKYDIEHMEHGGWIVEAPSPLDAVFVTLADGEEAVLERITSKTMWFAIHDSAGDLIDHWMVRPSTTEVSDE